MFDSPSEVVDRYLLNAYALQFTNGTEDEYQTVIDTEAPSPVVTVDCAPLSEYDEFVDAIGDKLTTSSDNYRTDTFHIKQHFQKNEGTLVLKHFDTLEGDALTNLAQYIKGLAEQTNIGIILIVEDTDAVFTGNPDLGGRVRAVDFSEY